MYEGPTFQNLSPVTEQKHFLKGILRDAANNLTKASLPEDISSIKLSILKNLEATEAITKDFIHLKYNLKFKLNSFVTSLEDCHSAEELLVQIESLIKVIKGFVISFEKDSKGEN